MKGVYRFFLFAITVSFFIISCKKDGVSNAKKYAGVYVGDVSRVEFSGGSGSIVKTTVIKNCTIIITSTDNAGQVTVETDKIFYQKMIGSINGENLTLTQKESSSSGIKILKSYGSASFSGNSINIDFKSDDTENGSLYYQNRWTGSLKK